MPRPISPSHATPLAAQPESSFDRVKKNAKGGVLVTNEEIATAFGMLDLEKNSVITLATLKKRLGLMFPDMSAKDYRFLMNNKKEMSLEDLRELLLDNEIAQFDPVAEAFKAFDPAGGGAISEDLLRQAFISFGLGELSDEELDILKRSADLDGDAKITLDDFRDLLEGAPRRQAAEPNAALRARYG